MTWNRQTILRNRGLEKKWLRQSTLYNICWFTFFGVGIVQSFVLRHLVIAPVRKMERRTAKRRVKIIHDTTLTLSRPIRLFIIQLEEYIIKLSINVHACVIMTRMRDSINILHQQGRITELQKSWVLWNSCDFSFSFLVWKAARDFSIFFEYPTYICSIISGNNRIYTGVPASIIDRIPYLAIRQSIQAK